jgi:O-antigen/teichoic acid export membrane protein
MIAYSTGSWINNAADRYLVSLIKGVAVNGLYGVAYKIPAILTVFQRIFAQAWQMSATKSYEDDNSAEFFTTMYNVYNTFMVAGCSFLILSVRLFAWLMFKKDFYEAWMFVPPLLISVVFGALTGFLGSICLAYKDSKAMGWATGTGAAVNIALNLLLIPGYGAMGAAIATAVSYYLMYLFAYIKVKGHVKLEIKLIRDYFAYILLAAEAVIMIKGAGAGAFAETGMRSGPEIRAGIIFVIIVILYAKELLRITDKLLKAPRKQKTEQDRP